MSRSYIYPLTIIASLFFVFGFLTWINGILIPYFQICLVLDNFQATLVAFASYAAYFFMALPSAWILKFTGYKKGIFFGLLVMAVGTGAFIPAAYLRAYPLFLTGLFITGSGLALLQTAANPYVAIIGPIESHAQRIGFMGLANKVAGLLSLTIFGAVFLFDADAITVGVSAAGPAEKIRILDAYALKIVQPYLLVTGLLLLLAVTIWYSRLPELSEEGQTRDEADDKRVIWNYPHLLLGVFSLFCAAGCEVIPIDGIILYGKSLGIPIEQSRHFAQYTLYMMIAGYAFSTIFIPRFLSQQKALTGCALWGIAMSLAAYLNSGILSVVFVSFMGFSSAMLWGTIWGLSLRNLGKFTNLGAALLLMAVIGGGIFPVIFGRLIDLNAVSPQRAILLLIPCNVVLLLFSRFGYRIKSWKYKRESKRSTI